MKVPKIIGSIPKPVVDHVENKVPMRLELNREQLIAVLKRAGVELPIHTELIEITVKVPGGGDWSNEDLTIDRDTIITLRWKQ